MENAQELQHIKTMPPLEGRTTWRKPLLFSVASQMLLRETDHKTKVSFHKSLRNFRSFLHGGYQKLPRSFSFNPFLCGICNARTHTSDRFYNEFYDHLQSDLSRMKRFGNNEISKSKEPAIEDAACSFMLAKQSPQKKSFHEDKPKERKNKGNSQLGKKEDLNNGAHVLLLAQKMRELDMMDKGDLEHVLDIEEALHYYSRLKSPVYLDIVDQFFMAMHSELSVPQPSVSVRPSKQRLGSIRL